MKFCLALLLLSTTAFGADSCPPSGASGDGILVGWVADLRETTKSGAGAEASSTRVEPFRVVALVQDRSITETPGASIFKGQTFWRAAAPNEPPVDLESVGSFLDRTGKDHCVYFGTLSNPNLPQWTLLTNKAMAGVFKAPTEKDKARFEKEKSECIVQGDYDPDEQPPCSKPELLAVSDINKNGKPEYWATEIYRWDTGLSVWEDVGTLEPIFQVCVGCSD